MDDIFQGVNPFAEPKEDKIAVELAKGVSKLLEMLEGITEFTETELKSISVLETDLYFSKFLEFYIANKKHKKRQFAKEVLEAFNSLLGAVGNQRPSPMLPRGDFP